MLALAVHYFIHLLNLKKKKKKKKQVSYLAHFGLEDKSNEMGQGNN